MAGRPTSNPRLRDIDPVAFGAEVHDAVLGHIAHLAIRIDVTWSAEQGHSSSLRWTAQLLAGYAQIGLAATDWPDHGCAADALLDVCSSLYSCAGDPEFGLGELDGEVDASTAIGVVLLAAHARIRIAQRQRVPARELAALAGVDAAHVRLLGRKGELEVEGTEIRAAEARRWLAARGVRGFTKGDGMVRWSVCVAGKEAKTLGHYPDADSAYAAVERVEGDARITIEFGGDREVTFDPKAPRLRDALPLLLSNAPHWTVPNVATMLRVRVARLQQALEPLRGKGIVEAMERGTERETWVMNQVAPTLEQVVELAERRGIDLGVYL